MRNYWFHTSILVMLVSFMSCDQNKGQIEQFLQSSSHRMLEGRLLHTDSRLINIPSEVPSDLRAFRVFDSTIYCFSFNTPQDLYRVDIEGSRVEHFFNFEKGVKFKIMHFLVDEDVIATISEEGDIVEYRRKEQEYRVIRTNRFGENPSDYGMLLPTIMNPPALFRDDSSYIFNVYPLGYFENHSVSEKQELPTFARFNFKNDRLTYFGKPYGLMSAIGSNLYPYDMSFPYLTLLDSGEYIMAYPMSHQINHFDKISSAHEMSYPNTSILAPLNYEEYQDSKLKREYRISAPYYSAISKHPSAKFYSRVFYHQREVSNDRGKYAIKYHGASILTFNNTFELIAIDPIEIDQTLMAIIPKEDGYFIIKNVEDNEDQILIEKYSYSTD